MWLLVCIGHTWFRTRWKPASEEVERWASCSQESYNRFVGQHIIRLLQKKKRQIQLNWNNVIRQVSKAYLNIPKFFFCSLSQQFKVAQVPGPHCCWFRSGWDHGPSHLCRRIWSSYIDDKISAFCRMQVVGRFCSRTLQFLSQDLMSVCI